MNPFRAGETPRRTEGRVVHGPFPIRAGRLLGAITAVVLGGVLVALFLSTDVVACEAGEDGTCTVQQTLSRDARFPSASVRDVRVDHERGSKGAKYGVDVLVLEGGGTLRLRRVDEDQAEQAARTIREGLASHGAFQVTLRDPWYASLLGVGMAVFGVVLARSAVRGMGRYAIDVVAGGQALRVTRRILGVAVSSREVFAADAERVDVDVGVVPDAWKNRGEADPVGGRVVIVDHSGERRLLSDDFHRGEAIHLRAAIALSGRLGLAAGELEARLASLPWRQTRMVSRIAYAWMGITVGSMVGVALMAITGLALGLLHARDGPEAWMFVPGAVAGVAVVLFLTRRRPPL